MVLLPTRLRRLRNTVQQAISECDLIISTAGVSVGDYDFLTTVIDDLGQINHYKVAMKPESRLCLESLKAEKKKKNRFVFWFTRKWLSIWWSVVCSLSNPLWRLSAVNEMDLVYKTTHNIKKRFNNCCRWGEKPRPYPSRFALYQKLSQANCFVGLCKTTGEMGIDWAELLLTSFETGGFLLQDDSSPCKNVFTGVDILSCHVQIHSYWRFSPFRTISPDSSWVIFIHDFKTATCVLAFVGQVQTNAS